MCVDHLVVVCFCCAVGGAAEDRGIAPHFHFPAELVLRNAMDIRYRRTRMLEIRRENEIHVRVFRGEAAAGGADPRAHDRGARLL